MKNWIAPGISQNAIAHFFSENRAHGNDIHTLGIWENDACAALVAAHPYDCADKREVYSLSKTFCATAIGMLCDAGLLSVEDRIVDLFPEEVPAQPSAHLLAMRVRHVLSMNTGHAGCVFAHMAATPDAVRAFFAEPLPYEPGTHFAYNTGATFLLSLIVTKITGMTLLDYLQSHLFCYLGIEHAHWTNTQSGANEGGTGIYVSCEDILKLGQLYLHHGVYHGKRLLSEAWIAAASSAVSDNRNNGTPDWTCGYGYQIWLNSFGGYRGDGAAGQLMVILPKEQVIVAVQAECLDTQMELTLVDQLVRSLHRTDDATCAMLSYPPCSGAVAPLSNDGVWYRADKNPMGITTFSLSCRENILCFTFSQGDTVQTISAANGAYLPFSFTGTGMMPKLIGLMRNDFPELLRGYASFEQCGEAVKMVLRLTNSPRTLTYLFRLDGDTATVQIDATCGCMPAECRVLTGRAIRENAHKNKDIL